jgi:hypothetical protein
MKNKKQIFFHTIIKFFSKTKNYINKKTYYILDFIQPFL